MITFLFSFFFDVSSFFLPLLPWPLVEEAHMATSVRCGDKEQKMRSPPSKPGVASMASDLLPWSDGWFPKKCLCNVRVKSKLSPLRSPIQIPFGGLHRGCYPPEIEIDR